VTSPTWNVCTPKACQRTSTRACTEANYRTYAAYGNHSSVENDANRALDALIKEQKKGWCIIVDPRVMPFVLNSHLTPIGLINIDHPYKKPRLIWDASFRPKPDSFAFNNWTSMETEPPIRFATAFLETVKYTLNLRASFPTTEILAG
jgi:hypothetical protein